MKVRKLLIIYITNVTVKAPAGSRDIVNFVSCLYVHNKGLGFLKLANIVLILMNPGPCYVKFVIILVLELLD